MPEKCPDNCPLVPRVQRLEEENKRHTETHKEIFERLRKEETNSAVQKEQYKTIVEKLDGLDRKIDSAISKTDKRIDGVDDDVEALEAKPGEKWDNFGNKILWFIAEAILLFVAVKIGLR